MGVVELFLIISFLCFLNVNSQQMCCSTSAGNHSCTTEDAVSAAAGSDMCKTGFRQSPVDICIIDTDDLSLPPLCFVNHWADNIEYCISQTGNTVLFRPVEEDYPMILEGGPLYGTFLFDQLHFHWGKDDCSGSEHSINGEKFSMEAHLVYYNFLYGSAKRAIGRPSGIAILSVLMASKDSYHNCHMDTIVNTLIKLNCPEATIRIPRNVMNIFKHILVSGEYYTYDGSLSTPPCCEDVVWIIFKKFICLHRSQIEPFRSVRNATGHAIISNCRETQPLNCRIIYNVRTCYCCPSCA